MMQQIKHGLSRLLMGIGVILIGVAIKVDRSVIDEVKRLAEP